MKKFLITLSMLSTIISLSYTNTNDCIDNRCSINTNKDDKHIIENINKNNFIADYIFYTAIWCGHCRAQYEFLQEIYDRHNSDVNFKVVIAEDYASKKDIENFITQYNYTFPVYFDANASLIDILNIRFYPTIFNSKLKKLNIDSLNLNEYNEIFKDEIDAKTREKLKDIKVLDENKNELTLLNLMPSNALIMYGAPWCKDCKQEIERLKSIKGKRQLIYLIDSKKFSFEDFVEYKKNNKENYKIYYVNSNEIREKFNINWIPAVTEIKNSKFTGPFVANNKYIIK